LDNLTAPPAFCLWINPITVIQGMALHNFIFHLAKVFAQFTLFSLLNHLIKSINAATFHNKLFFVLTLSLTVTSKPLCRKVQSQKIPYGVSQPYLSTPYKGVPSNNLTTYFQPIIITLTKYGNYYHPIKTHYFSTTPTKAVANISNPTLITV
jgi:hypothetical protein